jgi:hypothetical protein
VDLPRAAAALQYGLTVFDRIYEAFAGLDEEAQSLLGDPGQHLHELTSVAAGMYGMRVNNEKAPTRTIAYIVQEVTGEALQPMQGLEYVTSFAGATDAIRTNREAAAEMLWEKQKALWPNSERITFAYIATSLPSYRASAALALQHDVVVFYQLSIGMDDILAYRWGIEDDQYTSMMSAGGSVVRQSVQVKTDGVGTFPASKIDTGNHCP